MTRPFPFLFSSLVCALAGRTAADVQRGHRPDWFLSAGFEFLADQLAVQAHDRFSSERER